MKDCILLILQITREDNNFMETLKYQAYILAELIHLFFLSFEGQKLIDHSLQMRNRM